MTNTLTEATFETIVCISIGVTIRQRQFLEQKIKETNQNRVSGSPRASLASIAREAIDLYIKKNGGENDKK